MYSENVELVDYANRIESSRNCKWISQKGQKDDDETLNSVSQAGKKNSAGIARKTAWPGEFSKAKT